MLMCMHAGPFSSARPTAVAFVAVAGVMRRSRPVIMATYRDSPAGTVRRPPKKFQPHNVSGSKGASESRNIRPRIATPVIVYYDHLYSPER